ncbi:unnamed protein product [Pylaiella littoralis]
MSRFIEYGLHKRTDELLRPAEKCLRGLFYSPTNTDFLYKKTLSDVDPGFSYGDLETIMDEVFLAAIATDDLPDVSDVNERVLDRIRKSAERINIRQVRYIERAFEHSNIPTRFLPRPSYASRDAKY